MFRIEFDGSFDAWRSKARDAFRKRLAPAEVRWCDPWSPQQDLLSTVADLSDVPERELRVSKALVDAIRLASFHRDPERWAVAYRLLWRVGSGERGLSSDAADPDVARLRRLGKEVRRDAHKMKAFVRFRRVEDEGGEHFVAWHRPDHRIVRHTAPFFADRFAPMRWTILTPEESVHWDTRALHFGEGVPRSEAPDGDALEDLWRTYYRSIFNPARVMWSAMLAEMPMKHWPTLPETQVIAELVREAPERVAEMIARQHRDASAFLPEARTLEALRDALPTCAACELCARGSGPVRGEGPSGATLMIVGEQPGDEEDRSGRPFVGPAGRVLDDALRGAGVARDAVYVTNAVKAFRFEERGEKRIHKRPGAGHVERCRPWLAREVALVRPSVILCLGSTAGRSVLGKQVGVRDARGRMFETLHGAQATVTWHPAAVLRAEGARRRALAAELARDVQRAASASVVSRRE